jgi:2-methylcitrate dehydratase PrpD
MMTGKFNPLTASMALGVATYAAMLLNCLAHEELDLSDGQICKYAVSGALVISAALAASSLRWGDGKAR